MTEVKNKLPISDKIYVGIDPSFTNTAVSFLQNGTIKTKSFSAKGLVGMDRVDTLVRSVLEHVTAPESGPVAGVAIEGYAMGARGDITHLAELGGILRLELYRRKVNLIEVPPTVLKKHITGKGNGKKELVLKELYKQYGVDLDSNDEADAAALAIIATEFYEEPFHFLVSLRHYLHTKCKLLSGDYAKFVDREEYAAELDAYQKEQGLILSNPIDLEKRVKEFEESRKRRKQDV